ncbi:hypothetical protein B4U80_11801 [Leptotrombidium deliense]|uniref:RRM domain-containing protein n=1 Tax=Leptotrombidium deliense TaxID=299467 RepID=A0A443S2A3_9ACAR|nr:hypothetical protein B4U80_11801 [Leptotrombidium deliense]
MADRSKPLYLAKSVKELEQILSVNSTSPLIPTKLIDCYLSANLAWLQDDHELAFLLYGHVINYSHSRRIENVDKILSEKQILEVKERIATLKIILEIRYKSIECLEIMDSIDNTINECNTINEDNTIDEFNTINEYNTVQLNNFPPKYNEFSIICWFSKYGKIRNVCFNVEGERGFGYVEFEMPSSAFEAATMENGRKHYGRHITVQRKKEMTPSNNELNTIHLDNLSPKCNKNFIEDLFSKYGKIKKIRFDIDVERGYALIEFELRSSAYNAVSEENGKLYDGHNIIAELAVADRELSCLLTSVKISDCNADCLLNDKSGHKIDKQNVFKKSTDMHVNNVIKNTELTKEDNLSIRKTGENFGE